MTLNVKATQDRTLRHLLEKHPYVGLMQDPPPHGVDLEFEQDGWMRTISVTEGGGDGLLELADNNPFVCSDAVKVPSSAATLALVAAGPAALAGIIIEPPAMLASYPVSEEDISNALQTVGWFGGSVCVHEPQALGGALAVTMLVEISNPDSFDDIDSLYEEAYGRSFCVRREETGDWDSRMVIGGAHALYRLRLTPGVDRSLLTILAMADANGKCGAAQIVHTMNVMAGFEETIGLPGA